MDAETRDGSTVLSTLAAGVALIFGVVALGVSVANHSSSGAQTVSSPPAAKDQRVRTVVRVTLTDFKIAADPATVPAGPVTLVVKNSGPSKHNLGIAGIGRTADIAPGTSAELDLGSLEAGTYTWECSIAGHKEAGMTGTLAVIPRAGGPAVTKGGSAAPAIASDTTAGPDYKAVDAAHKKVVQEFLSGPPAKTEGLGGQLLAPTIENGVKVFNLTAKVVQWEVAPGKRYEAWTYNGVVPGPQLRIKQGERALIRLKNELPQSTSIHFHGVEIADNKQDGVTFVTQDPILPGATYTYDITPINCGSHMYHSHHAADSQVPLGLLGAFVDDCTTTTMPAFAAHDSEYTEILTDGPLGFGINGKSFPATAPVVTKVGEKTLIRFMNEGLIIHPMHLHGHRMTVVAKDGNYLPQPYDADTLNIAPGERYDVVVTSTHPGAWAFHCHILSHAESDVGLHGMTTVWVVNP